MTLPTSSPLIRSRDPRRGPRVRWLFTVLMAASLLSVPARGIAGPGDLDPSFGLGGKVWTDIVTGEGGRANAIEIQPDGRIVVAGDDQGTFDSNVVVARYLADGSPDPDFGVNGRVAFDLGYFSEDSANAVALQPDGKIVVAGTVDVPDPNKNDVFVARLLADGSFDPDFAMGGVVVTDYNATYNDAYGVALQGDGKIVVAGTVFTGAISFTATDLLVLRYNPDGTLDTSFSGDGIVQTTVSPGNAKSAGVAVDGSGRIVVGGFAWSGSSFDFLVARYGSNGALDGSFSGDGLQTTSIGSSTDVGLALAIQGDGAILLAGYADIGGNDDFAVARYLANGNLDSAYSGDGKVTVPVGAGDDAITAARLDATGRLVVGGWAWSGTSYDFAAARFTTSGGIDPSFAGDGTATLDFDADEDVVRAVSIDSLGNVLVGGYAGVDGDNLLALARFADDGSPDAGFDDDGSMSARVGSGHEEGRGAVLDSFGRLVVVGSDNGSIHLVRYEADGSIDRTFGFGGVSSTSFAPAGIGVSALLRLPADEWMVSGYLQDGTGIGPTLFRFLADGTLDPAFGDAGVARILSTELGGIQQPSGVALQEDGAVVATGTWNDPDERDIVVWRVNADGSSDESFGVDGIARIDLEDEEFAYDVAVAPDGRIVVLGGTTATGVVNDLETVVAMLHPDGVLDTEFGSDGITRTDRVGSWDVFSSIVIQPNGKLVLVGTSEPDDCVAPDCGMTDCAATRYDANGGLDTSFGASGLVTLDLSGDFDLCDSAAQQGDRILIGATADWLDEGRFTLVAIDGDGNPDSAYGGAGYVSTDMGADWQQVHDIVLQAGGAVLVGTAMGMSTTGDVALARFDSPGCGDGVLDSGEICDDGNLESGDGCDADCRGCPSAPRTGCLDGTAGKLQIVDSATPSKDKLSWQWADGPGFDQTAVGFPETNTAYALCVYDETAGSPELQTSTVVYPDSELWTEDPGKGASYKDPDRGSDGVKKLQVKTGAAGRTRLKLSAQGARLSLPGAATASAYFMQGPRVLVQMVTSHGSCWSNEFVSEDTSVNDGASFKAKAK